MKYSIISILFFIFSVLSDAATITQNMPSQDGPMINEVTGKGSSATTLYKSTTEYTPADGGTIVSQSSFHSSTPENGSVIVERINIYCWLIFVIAALMTYFF